MKKLTKHTKTEEYKKELSEVFYKICSDKSMVLEFLADILTPAEFEALALRWQIVKRIHKGETHRTIAGELGLGISTVTRGSRELNNKNGGFTQALKKLGIKTDK